MMGREDPPQPSLFYTSFSLDKRVRSNHPLRKVSKVIDFGFVSDDVEHLYGYNGNVSVPPPESWGQSSDSQIFVIQPWNCFYENTGLT